jgi:two-component system, OmpR family, sensor histidine kinase ChvG
MGVVFAVLPVLVYDQFRRADAVTQELLRQGAERQGRLIARALEPDLQALGGSGLPGLGQRLERFAEDGRGVKLLVRPRALSGGEGFFYIAAAPAVPLAALDGERRDLIESGVLDRLGESCGGMPPLARRVAGPDGGEEVLTSITPVVTGFGCWAVVTSHSTGGYLDSSLGRPYWRTAVVQVAALIYLTLAGLVLAVLTGAWRDLGRFRDLARGIVNGEAEGSFAERNAVPELAGVADDLDRLVASLRRSSETLRQAAEDAAHAFKTPIAVIRQSTEPLRRALPADAGRSQRAIAMIEASVDKLDALVSSTRRMDTATAGLFPVPRRRVDLTGLVRRMAESYGGQFQDRGLALAARIASGIVVRAGEDMLETVIENLLENAASFSPPGAVVHLTLARAGAEVRLSVEDEGPGVPPSNLERIFERYFSSRRPEHAGAPHFGIGLWIVRRNIEAVGGRVEAENRTEGGFRMRVVLPVAAPR